jgi:hypothetical protein
MNKIIILVFMTVTLLYGSSPIDSLFYKSTGIGIILNDSLSIVIKKFDIKLDSISKRLNCTYKINSIRSKIFIDTEKNIIKNINCMINGDNTHLIDMCQFIKLDSIINNTNKMTNDTLIKTIITKQESCWDNTEYHYSVSKYDTTIWINLESKDGKVYQMMDKLRKSNRFICK